MTVRIRTIAIVACLPLALGGCGALAGDPGPVPLTITTSTWNGWDRDHEPRPESVEVEATKGATTRVGRLEITFTDVDDDSVDLTTSEPLSVRSQEGGFSVRDSQTEFTVTRGEELRLRTPTMDAGTSWTVVIAD